MGSLNSPSPKLTETKKMAYNYSIYSVTGPLYRAGLIWMTVTILLMVLSLITQQASAQTGEIIFLAGPKDHGMPGRHAYEKDLCLLAQSLEESTNIGNLC